jgi:hypothetical protein
LSYDLAQDGELVEPFVICILPARRLSGGVLGIFPIQPTKLSQ